MEGSRNPITTISVLSLTSLPPWCARVNAVEIISFREIDPFDLNYITSLFHAIKFTFKCIHL